MTLPDLDAIFGMVWDGLAQACRVATDGWHTPTLCTSTAAGAPAARTVVLRAVDPTQSTIGCHTDLRAPKVVEIRHNPRVAWVFYDASSRRQLRVTGHAEVLTEGPDVDAAWARTAASSRRCYLAPRPPSARADAASPNLPEAVRHHVPSLPETESGRAVFAVVRCRADALDWLHLRHDGHVRAGFHRDDAGRWNAAWLEP